MIIRTPRRRVSPRTKLKYRAIKKFFRKVKGTSSGNNNTYSSIEVSVSDLQTKIEGIEQELNRVSKHCQDISCLQANLAKESENIVLRDDTTTKNHTKSHRNVKDVETKLLYKSSSRQFRKTDGSNETVNLNSHDRKYKMNARDLNQNLDFPYKIKNNKYGKFEDRNEWFTERQRSPKLKIKTAPCTYSTSSFHSLVEPKNKHNAQPGGSKHRQRRAHNTEHIRSVSPRKSQSRNKRLRHSDEIYDQRHRDRHKRDYSELDEDFIDKIIKKQYKPIKIFGTRDSDFSQFSAPVCRDQEFVIRDDVQEGSELCSCCLSGNRRYKHHYVCRNDISDMKSICDTRLYSSKRHRHHRIPRYCKDDYNNSNYYDIVPVKEKSSPKSRRKFIEDNAIAYQYCREVPPSPRSHRPRLNLKAQNYTEYNDDLRHNRQKMHQFQENRKETYETNLLSDSASVRKRANVTLTTIRPQNITEFQDNKEIISNLESPTFVNEQTNMSYNDTTLNTQATDITVDKTDKTLGEIKDILQNFLLEIKKESIHSEKSNITSKLEDKSFNNTVENEKINNTAIPNSGHNSNMGQYNGSPFLPPFANPCCYPLIPMYTIHCMQNGYVMPSPSFTCAACAKNSMPNTCANQDNSNYGKDNQNKEKASEQVNTSNETQELIKEIYKFVSQNPKTPRKFDANNRNDVDHLKGERRTNKTILTNRSVGGSSKHDANVGTSSLRRCSKSCEAISSRVNSDTHRTNASYSDTVLDKLSLKESESSTESNASSDVAEKKSRRMKFQKLLKSLRLFKKKRKGIIEEASESESTIEVDVKQKTKPPFMQHITNYAMHGQDFFHPPPIPEHSSPPHSKHHHNHDCYHQPFHPEIYQQHVHAPMQMPYDHRKPLNYNPLAYPNYDPYNQIPPQVPLCLKEIEVKSIATQSDRKMSIFKKFAKKPQPNPQNTPPPPVKNTKPSFWDSLQEKSKQRANPDPMDFSLKTQKQLAQGDMKLRNAMLKKLFYKRNPFSPRNLIVRTLLGKDKSSFGDPPKMYKPRMFL